MQCFYNNINSNWICASLTTQAQSHIQLQKGHGLLEVLTELPAAAAAAAADPAPAAEAAAAALPATHSRSLSGV